MSDEAKLVALQREALNNERAAYVREFDWKQECERRRDTLRKLLPLLQQHEQTILHALHADLGKSETEAFTTEFALVRAEVHLAIKKLKQWMRPRRKCPSMATFPAWGRVQREPYGLVLILSPWNYPFQLSMIPLVGAIAAGNRCILKPSAQCPQTAKAVQDLVAAWLPKEQAAVLLGGHDVSDRLLNERFDHIFFTGSTDIGKMVMRKAAEHLTPVTLELGGKSPCIVDASADLDLAARRIAFGKTVNAGQTCVAPDYVLAHWDVAEKLIGKISDHWRVFYGPNILGNPAWPRIISDKHLARLLGLLENEKVASGGHADERRMEPTILYPTAWESPLMQEEIFGPILPVIPYDHLDEALSRIRQMETPLAFYMYTGNRKQAENALRSVPFGGGCVNDCLMHIANHHLPFGGLGNSGMGNYHGEASFRCFTHEKSVLMGSRIDNPLRYPPYTERKNSLLRRLLK